MLNIAVDNSLRDKTDNRLMVHLVAIYALYVHSVFWLEEGTDAVSWKNIVNVCHGKADI